MNFRDLVEKRYSVRKFSEQAVEPEKITQILEYGRLAPTSVNFQPQRILVLNNSEAMAKLKLCTPYHFNAPAALLVCFDKNEDWKSNFDDRRSGQIDASIVATHLLLAVADIGLGATWVMYFDPQRVRQAYSLPRSVEPVALLVLGYPAANAKPGPLHNERKPLAGTTFYNSF